MQHNAHLKRLAMQVELHTDLEQKLPARILRAGERDKYTVYMHTAKYFITGVGKNDILRVKFVVAWQLHRLHPHRQALHKRGRLVILSGQSDFYRADDLVKTSTPTPLSTGVGKLCILSTGEKAKHTVQSHTAKYFLTMVGTEIYSL